MLRCLFFGISTYKVMEELSDTQAFINFLEKKKINWQTFQTLEPQVWQDLIEEFALLGVNGFDQRKKFFINNWRLKYPPATSGL